MKKKLQFIAMLFALISVLFGGCKKEQDPQTAIVGKWSPLSAKTRVWENGVLKGEMFGDFEAGSMTEFKADNTWLITMISFSGGGIYTINGNKITIKSDQGETESEIAFPNNKTLKFSRVVERTTNGITYREEHISEYVRK